MEGVLGLVSVRGSSIEYWEKIKVKYEENMRKINKRDINMQVYTMGNWS